jgi:hypothetical protein
MNGVWNSTTKQAVTEQQILAPGMITAPLLLYLRELNHRLVSICWAFSCVTYPSLLHVLLENISLTITLSLWAILQELRLSHRPSTFNTSKAALFIAPCTSSLPKSFTYVFSDSFLLVLCLSKFFSLNAASNHSVRFEILRYLYQSTYRHPRHQLQTSIICELSKCHAIWKDASVWISYEVTLRRLTLGILWNCGHNKSMLKTQY